LSNDDFNEPPAAPGRGPDALEDQARLALQAFIEFILKYQLYPWAHRDLARRVRAELGLPVDAPRALEEGTMMRFLRWHESL
jgi:hypothetical protein